MIQAHHLCKNFSSIQAVNGVSFRLEAGEIVALLGPNGAGKTTCMRILSGYFQASSGYARIAGFDSHTQALAAKKHLGYLSEHAPLYQEHTVMGYLRFIAQVRGLSRALTSRALDEVFEYLALDAIAWQPIHTLSKGSMRRVALAAAVLHKPPALLLDEPTEGLDPIQKRQVREYIQELSKNCAVLMCTHQIDDVLNLCPRTLIMAQGKLLLDRSTEELLTLSKYHNAVSFVAQESIAARAALEGLSGINGFEQNRHDGRLYVFVHGNKPQNQLIADRLQQKNVPFFDLRLEYGRLDEVFDKVVRSQK